MQQARKQHRSNNLIVHTTCSQTLLNGLVKGTVLILQLSAYYANHDYELHLINLHLIWNSILPMHILLSSLPYTLTSLCCLISAGAQIHSLFSQLFTLHSSWPSTYPSAEAGMWTPKQCSTEYYDTAIQGREFWLA